MNFPMNPTSFAMDISRKYCCSDQIFPCYSHHTCEVERHGVVRMSSGEVVVAVKLIRDGVCHQRGFGPFIYPLRQCVHDLDVNFRVRMTSNQWQHVASQHEKFVLFQAKLKGDLLHTTVHGSGVICSPDRRSDLNGDDVHITCELFAGGFSGWAHALRRLCDMGFRIEHRLQ
jgi:hypothetical protein